MAATCRRRPLQLLAAHAACHYDRLSCSHEALPAAVSSKLSPWRERRIIEAAPRQTELWGKTYDKTRRHSSPSAAQFSPLTRYLTQHEMHKCRCNAPQRSLHSACQLHSSREFKPQPPHPCPFPDAGSCVLENGRKLWKSSCNGAHVLSRRTRSFDFLS